MGGAARFALIVGAAASAALTVDVGWYVLPPRSQGAFMFVITPPIACAAAIAAMATAGALWHPRR